MENATEAKILEILCVKAFVEILRQLLQISWIFVANVFSGVLVARVNSW